jgi:hypothetical protein
MRKFTVDIEEENNMAIANKSNIRLAFKYLAIVHKQTGLLTPSDVDFCKSLKEFFIKTGMLTVKYNFGGQFWALLALIDKVNPKYEMWLDRYTGSIVETPVTLTEDYFITHEIDEPSFYRSWNSNNRQQVHTRINNSLEKMVLGSSIAICLDDNGENWATFEVVKILTVENASMYKFKFSDKDPPECDY